MELITQFGEKVEITSKNWFVICTDKIMTNARTFDPKICKRVYICADHQQAELWADRMRSKKKYGLAYISTTPKIYDYIWRNDYHVTIELYADNIWRY